MTRGTAVAATCAKWKEIGLFAGARNWATRCRWT